MKGDSTRCHIIYPKSGKGHLCTWLSTKVNPNRFDYSKLCGQTCALDEKWHKEGIPKTTVAAIGKDDGLREISDHVTLHRMLIMFVIKQSYVERWSEFYLKLTRGRISLKQWVLTLSKVLADEFVSSLMIQWRITPCNQRNLSYYFCLSWLAYLKRICLMETLLFRAS